MGRSKWLLLLLIPMLFGFDTRNPFRTRGPFKAADFTIGTEATGGCTDGVDCYCDTVSDPSLLWCEDWENAGYYENTSDSFIASSSGTVGGAGNRGGDSLWYNTFGITGSGLLKWSDGVPYLGTQCAYGPGSPNGYAGCYGIKEYCSTAQGTLAGVGSDCWGPNVNSGSCIDIQRSGDFTAEVGSLTLTGGKGTASDVGSGNSHLAYRTPVGTTCGIVGYKNLGASVTEVGVTMALAYSSNMASISLFDEPFKHDEWSDSSQTWLEHWNLGRTGAGDDTVLPYRPFVWTTSCSSALAPATIHIGAANCSGGEFAMKLGASSAVYQQARDFPWGTWACHRAHISGLGTTNVTIKIWHNSDLIMWISGLDGTYFQNQTYRYVAPNNYSNSNGGAPGTSPTTQTGYRYQDNIHITNGPPVSCSAIGF